MLVLAGAGSGKTRTLVHKIAYGLCTQKLSAQNFLAMTFTNKAASEMKDRVSALVGESLQNPWVLTFHSMGHKILRKYSSLLGFSSDFTIFDSSDQTSLVKNILKNLNYDNTLAQARKISKQIQFFKSDLQAFQDIESYPWQDITRQVYDLYEPLLKKNNGFDFSDLLLKTHELLKKYPQVKEQLQDQFQYILVDEYQDTNLIQYEILKMLHGHRDGICVVGDEDQSIYGWRGANIFNVLNFDKDFPGTRTIQLEQNYRSTKNIVDAASAVISNNTQRKNKVLFTNSPQGEPIVFSEQFDEYGEAKYIVKKIEQMISKGIYTYSDFAIFYRTNAQSRILEEKLREFQIPHQIFGGLKFYDRKEVKDIMAYMRLVVNPKDDVSFQRILNSPPRGLGSGTLEKIINESQTQQISFVEASIDLLKNQKIKGSISSKLTGFLNTLNQLREICVEKDLKEFYIQLLDMTKYLPSLIEDGSIEATNRIQNLEEFGNAIAAYLDNHPESPHISDFLHHISLNTDTESGEKNSQSQVYLMTVHVAKGLEFPVVFIAGLEEGLFPLVMKSKDNESNMEIEEERRLFYVGMTRAKEKLYLCRAYQRKVWGQSQDQELCRFVSEIPETFLAEPLTNSKKLELHNHKSNLGFRKNYRKKINTRKTENSFGTKHFLGGQKQTHHKSLYKKGIKVHHPHFGPGVVEKVEGKGSREKSGCEFWFRDQSLLI